MKPEVEQGSVISRLNTIEVAGVDLCPRILFELRRRKAMAGQVKMWKSLFAVLLLVTSLLVIPFTREEKAMIADIGKTYAINIPTDRFFSSRVIYARVKLPDGVQFFSATYPELKYLDELVLEKQVIFNKEKRFPIIIKSLKKGKKVINVNYFNDDLALVDSINIAINFI